MCYFRFMKTIPCILFTSMDMSCNFTFTKTVSSLIDTTDDGPYWEQLFPAYFFEHSFLIGSTHYFDPPLSIKAIPTHLPLTHQKRDFNNQSKPKTENLQKLSWITASSALLQSPSVKKRCSVTDAAFGTIVHAAPALTDRRIVLPFGER